MIQRLASEGARSAPDGSGSLIIVITSRGCTSILDHYRPLHIYHLAHKYRLMLPVCPNGNLLSPALFFSFFLSFSRSYARCTKRARIYESATTRIEREANERRAGNAIGARNQLTTRSYGSLIKQSRQPGQLSKGSSRVSEGDSSGLSRAFVFRGGR